MGARCPNELETWDQLRKELEAAHARLLEARGKLKDEERELERVMAKVMSYMRRR